LPPATGAVLTEVPDIPYVLLPRLLFCLFLPYALLLGVAIINWYQRSSAGASSYTMTGPSIDPATLSTISAKIDYALTQLSIINEKLDSYEERLAPLEKFQQAEKVGSLLRRATLAGGYIIDGAPSAAPPSSTTSPTAAAVPAQFHTAAQFAAPAAAAGDVVEDGGAADGAPSMM